MKKLAQYTRTLLSENGYCFPFSEENLAVAFSEINIQDIADALKKGKHKTAGEMIAKKMMAYWEEKAESMAKEIIDEEKIMEGYCKFCVGNGCHHCERRD